MAVIVGKPARATPMLRVRLNAVQFNPPWGVPERNAREDLLPRFRRDPAGDDGEGLPASTAMSMGQRVEIDPTTIDWASVNPQRFPYFIRQDAGDINALGRIKFIMPNAEDIYMHDTPDRHLFRRPDRAFSSGCIRLEKPMELLDVVLQGTAGWDRARVERVLASRATTGVAVARSIPVRLHYTTAVVEGGAGAAAAGHLRARRGLCAGDGQQPDAGRQRRASWAMRAEHAGHGCRPAPAAPAAGRRLVLAARAAAGRGVGGWPAPRRAAAQAQLLGGGPRSLSIQRMQTGESFAGDYWRDGRYDREALRQLDWVLRDPSLEEATPMDPRLFDVMATCRAADGCERGLPGHQRLPGAGDQCGAGAANPRRVSRASLHMSGMAADVRLPGRDSIGHGAAGGGDAGRRRRAVSAGRLRASGLRPGAALV